MAAPRDRGSGARARRSVATDDALRLIEAHCRYAKTILPRAVVGVEAAIEYLHHLPAACRRMLPDLTGSAPKFAGSAVELGLLATTPSEKVARSVPRLVSAVSPVIESRTPRIWTWWIVRLLDADMQAKLREQTPRSQLEMAADPAPEPGISRRELKRRLAELGGEVERLTAERDQLAADKVALVSELEATRRRVDEVEPILDARARTIAELEAERDALRELLEKSRESAAAQAYSLERLDRIEAEIRVMQETTKPKLAAAEREVARLMVENAELQGRLARWGNPTPILLPEGAEQKPGWGANTAGRKVWISLAQERLGVYELRVETPDAPARTYTGLLGQVVLFVHLVHVGESEEEAGRIARVKRKGASG